VTDEAKHIAEIRERVEAATEGPWEAAVTGKSGVVWRPVQVGEDEWEQEKIADTDPRMAPFIAHSRQDIPFLLAALDEAVRLLGIFIPYMPRMGELEAARDFLTKFGKGE